MDNVQYCSSYEHDSVQQDSTKHKNSSFNSSKVNFEDSDEDGTSIADES